MQVRVLSGLPHSGSSSAWLEFSVWNRDAAGSNPAFPTKSCFGWKPRPVLTRLDCEERYLDEVPINAALAQLAGGNWFRTSTVSVRIRGAVPTWGMLKGKLVSLARRLYARSVTAILHHVEVDEESSWAVTPTQRFESAPHPTLASVCYSRFHRREATPFQSNALWPVRKGIRLIRGRQVVRFHSARPTTLSKHCRRCWGLVNLRTGFDSWRELQLVFSSITVNAPLS